MKSWVLIDAVTGTCLNGDERFTKTEIKAIRIADIKSVTEKKDNGFFIETYGTGEIGYWVKGDFFTFVKLIAENTGNDEGRTSEVG